MQRIPFRRIAPSGELEARIVKSFARLHDKPYLPGLVGEPPYMSGDWPGDWEGRTILALALESKALGVEAAYLSEIVKWVRSICNEKGYRGPVIDPDAINEQHYPSHSWLLRGLIAVYRETGEKWILDWIYQIIDNLFLPMAGHLKNYPQTSEDREIHSQGGAAGSASHRFREWVLSSDIGCVFIALDGLTEAYELTGRKEILDLAEEMIRLFGTLDYVGMGFQTHASLTVTRGIMRAWRLTGSAEALKIAETLFRNYKRYGMTEFYANLNWFKKPSWTEPCAVIDSYILACQLFEATNNADYLNDAHLIWYNGVLRGQRQNGGFGCDSCCEDGIVSARNGLYEANWCCTMRGGEGLTEPLRASVLADGNALVFTQYFDLSFALPDGTALKMRTKLPEKGETEIFVLSGQTEREFRFFVPEYAEDARLRRNGAPVALEMKNGFACARLSLKEGDALSLSFRLKLAFRPTVTYLHDGQKKFTLRNGALMLASEEPLNVPLRLRDYLEHPDAFHPLKNAWQIEKDEFLSTDYQLLYSVQPDDGN